MYTLVEVADQIEGSLSTEEGDELKKVFFPECGEIFIQLGYKVTVHAFVAQKPTQEVGEERRTSAGELRDKEEPEVERILKVELRECDEFKLSHRVLLHKNQQPWNFFWKMLLNWK